LGPVGETGIGEGLRVNIVRAGALALALIVVSPGAVPAALAQETAGSEIVPFCGLQEGIGLDRAMSREELDAYFGGGLPTYAWYPTERGCTADAPYALFDEAGAFLGFTEDAPSALPGEPADDTDPGQTSETVGTETDMAPVEDEAADEIAATAATVDEPESTPVDALDAESDSLESPPEEDQQESQDPESRLQETPEGETTGEAGVEQAEDPYQIQWDMAQGSKSKAWPRFSGYQLEGESLESLWERRANMIAICANGYGGVLGPLWMDPKEYESFAARWSEHRPEDTFGGFLTLGIASFQGFGDLSNFGSCETENGQLVSPDAYVACQTVGPNGERIPVDAWSNHVPSIPDWEDTPDINGRCPGDPRWTELGERINYGAFYAPEDAPVEVKAERFKLAADLFGLEDSMQIGDFITAHRTHQGGASLSDTLYAYGRYKPGTNAVCVVSLPGGGEVRTAFITPEEESDLREEIEAVQPYAELLGDSVQIIGYGDLSNYGSCATQNGVLQPAPDGFIIVCVDHQPDSEADYIRIPGLLLAHGEYLRSYDAPDSSGVCPEKGEPSPVVAPALPENVTVLGGLP
jgi:hypothetical protein